MARSCYYVMQASPQAARFRHEDAERGQRAAELIARRGLGLESIRGARDSRSEVP